MAQVPSLGYRRLRDKRFNACSSSVAQFSGRCHRHGSEDNAESSAFNLVRNGLSMPPHASQRRYVVYLPGNVLQAIHFP